ncbi:TetR/AcrR family transcriptional regulator [Geodermatophilus sp. SYSU D00691]
MEEPREDRRITQTRAAVHAATLAIIAEKGVRAATVERIADRAGVSRSTVYRRWPELRVLYYEAFAQLARRSSPELRGDTERELLHYLQDYADRLNDRTYGSVLVALIEAAWRDPQLADLRRSVFDERSSRAAAILEAGVRSGRLRADLDRREALDAVVAPFLYRRLVEQQRIAPADVRRLHADLLRRFGQPSSR